MPHQTNRERIHEAAREAIDEDALGDVLELVVGEELESDAAAALREVTADEIVADAVAAANRARRRGRLPTGDDIGDAAGERRACCLPQSGRRIREPLYAEIERS